MVLAVLIFGIMEGMDGAVVAAVADTEGIARVGCEMLSRGALVSDSPVDVRGFGEVEEESESVEEGAGM